MNDADMPPITRKNGASLRRVSFKGDVESEDEWALGGALLEDALLGGALSSGALPFGALSSGALSGGASVMLVGTCQVARPAKAFGKKCRFRFGRLYAIEQPLSESCLG